MSRFYRQLTHIANCCEWISRAIGQTVAWLSLAMALLIAGIVCLRTFFNIGSIAAQELVTYAHASLFMLAMAYALKENAHIRVDIIYRRCSQLHKAWIDTLGTLLFLLPFALFLMIISWKGVLTSWSIMEGSSNTGGIPAVFLLKTLLPIMGLLLLVQATAIISRNLITLTFDNKDT